GDDPLAAAHAGRADAADWSASVVLAEAARRVDAGVSGREAALLAARVRAVVAAGVRLVLREEEAGLGPGPFATDAAHARRVADLGLYLRQDHADHDLARLGRRAGEDV
ncbi:MAG: acyl-CoA dehydrogenase, partial [Microbacterium sp.]